MDIQIISPFLFIFFGTLFICHLNLPSSNTWAQLIVIYNTVIFATIFHEVICITDGSRVISKSMIQLNFFNNKLIEWQNELVKCSIKCLLTAEPEERIKLYHTLGQDSPSTVYDHNFTVQELYCYRTDHVSVCILSLHLSVTPWTVSL